MTVAGRLGGCSICFQVDQMYVNDCIISNIQLSLCQATLKPYCWMYTSRSLPVRSMYWQSHFHSILLFCRVNFAEAKSEWHGDSVCNITEKNTGIFLSPKAKYTSSHQQRHIGTKRLHFLLYKNTNLKCFQSQLNFWQKYYITSKAGSA